MKVQNSELLEILSKSPSKNVDNLKTGNNPSNNEFLDILNNYQQESDRAESSLTLRFSNHAKKRIDQREISFDTKELMKLNDAFTQLKNKGGKDSLVVTNNGIYILDVKNQTVVTALNKDNVDNNVFTKIDSTVFVN